MSVVPEPSISASRMRRWSNRSGVVEPRRVVHRHLGAEAAVAQVGPVADFAIADAHEVGEPIARHVGEVDGLGAIGEDQAWALLFIQRLRHALRRAETVFGQRRIPGEDFVFGDQDVGVAIAGRDRQT